MIYRICQCCGANLDPGEKCECMNKRKEILKRLLSGIKENDRCHMELKLEE